MTDVHVHHTAAIDRVFGDIFGRTRRWYLQLCLLATALGILGLAWPGQFLTQLPLWGGRSDAHTVAIYMEIGAAVTAVVMALTLVEFQPVVRFLRGKPVDAELVWRTIVQRRMWIAAQNTALYCIFGNIPIVLILGRDLDFTLWTTIGAIVAASMVTIAGGVFFIQLYEVAFQPIVQDLEPHLGDDFDPGRRWLTLGRRSVIATICSMLYAGAAISGLVAGADDRDERLLIVVVGTIGVAITFSGAITGLIAHSITSRVSVLRATFGSIGRGEYTVRVPMGSGDELDQIGRAVNKMAERLARNDVELRESRMRMAAVADAERRRMERDLRLGVQTQLAGLVDRLDEMGTWTALTDEVLADVADIRGTVADAIEETALLAQGMYPAVLQEFGLAAALAETAARSVLPTEVEVEGLQRFRTDIEAAIYFCCSEAIQNAARHAGPDARATVRLVRSGDNVEFAVSDTGLGYARAGVSGSGRGLTNMRDRIAAVGGDVRFDGEPGRGATVRGWVPV